MMERLIDFEAYEVKTTLKRLLQDKSTKKNIIWATNSYHHLGEEFGDTRSIEEHVFYQGFVLDPRILKCEETQQERTRKRAEVFTPSWVVNEMNNFCDEVWFGRRGTFNLEKDKSWSPVYQPVAFPQEKSWQDYVYTTHLEITCGEAPYLASRYDVSTGDKLQPTVIRMGILDRKLRVVNENTETKEDWTTWAVKAVESCYGYEYQGDNVLLARINVLMSFVEHYEERWHEPVEKRLLDKLANIISWNIWQMDGLTDTVPYGAPLEEGYQVSMFDFMAPAKEKETVEAMPCCIYDWRSKQSRRFRDLKESRRMKKFDFVIGNPPYQEIQEGGNKTYAKPIYPDFLDHAYQVADRALLIHPARFLFNAGSTPKAWNKKMLDDQHLKVVDYQAKSSEVFPGVDIKGGVAITYRDETKKLGPIEIFLAFSELNSIWKKVYHSSNFTSFKDIVYTRTLYRLTDAMHENHPTAIDRQSKGHAYDMSTNIFDVLPEIFFDSSPQDGKDYMQIYGRQNNKRCYKFIQQAFVNRPANRDTWKVFVPKSNGSGALGEVLSTPLIGEPLIGEPLIGHTEAFISIGSFTSREEAENCLKYVKSKFARCMLGVLKVTQDNPPDKWAYVPLQDFTNESDIDWSKPIAEVDQQLYKKYGLSPEEVDFIEQNVQEMV